MFKRSLHHGLYVFVIAALFLVIGGASPAAGATPATRGDYLHQDIVLMRNGDELVSSIVRDDKPFDSVGVLLAHPVLGLVANTDPDHGDMWNEVVAHDDGYGPSAFIMMPPTTAIRFKMPATPGEDRLVLKADLYAYDPPADPVADAALSADAGTLVADTTTSGGSLHVITRAEWGADETLRYWNPDSDPAAAQKADVNTEKTYSDPCADSADQFDKELGVVKVVDRSPAGDLLLWPLQYSKKIRKLVVHHTDSDIRDVNGDGWMDGRDYKEIVRSIYKYHAITRGWGDIGYNYLIDPLGNVYEGRYGGDMVIGAHVLCHNNGALGISMIGNYQDNDVPEPMQQALIRLLTLKARQHDVDPIGKSVFRGQMTDNIIGHRDLRPTACPGQKLYDLLPRIRNLVGFAVRGVDISQDNVNISQLDYNAEPLTHLDPIQLQPNERRKITLSFKNTGKVTWNNNTWLHVALNNDHNGRIVPILPDKSFVAANMVEDSVPPGQKGTFEAQIEGGYVGDNYTYELSPVVNGRFKISRASVWVTFSVEAPVFGYEVWSDTSEYALPSGNVFQGQKLSGSIALKNTGNVTWRNYGDHAIVLGTEAPRQHKSVFKKEDPAQLGYLYESEVLPGKLGHFMFDLTVPINRKGKIIERFTPQIMGVRWLEDKNLQFEVTIKKPQHIAQVTKLNPIGKLVPGEMVKISFRMKNAGDLTWDENNMTIGLLGRGIKVFRQSIVPLQPVPPGSTADFDFWAQAPYEAGTFSVFLNSKFNDTPIRGGGINYVISVPKPSLRAHVESTGDRAVSLQPGEVKSVTVTVKNTGNVIWRNKGPNTIYLAPSSPHDRESVFYVDGEWPNKYRAATMAENQVSPGETGTFTFKISTTRIGVHHEAFQLVIDQVDWLVGSSVFYDFRVFGKLIDSVNVKDANMNKKNASIITKGMVTPAPTAPAPAPVPAPTPVTPAPAPVPVKTAKSFRVRLSYADNASSITGDQNFNVIDKDGRVLFEVKAGQGASVSRLGDSIHVQVGTESKSSAVVRFVPTGDGIMQIASWQRIPAWDTSKKLNDNKFRGTLEVRVVNDQTAYIDELPLEDYLKGLAELSSDAPFEKQKAIAVLARTYARYYMQDSQRKFPGLPYDGSDDPDVFQRYLGYGVEIRNATFVGAVAVTKNEVVTFNGQLVKTPYFNQDDGRTRSAEEVWGWKDAPYLVSVPDPDCAGLTLLGHGVGLSGCGATAKANRGETYDMIIKYYYTGVKVEALKF